MKACSYCGRENDDAVLQCIECGTSFSTEPSGTLADVARWSPRSPLELALTSGVAAVLISTGIYFTIGRLTRDIFRMFYTADTGMPVGYDVVMFFRASITQPLLSIGATTFTLIVCCRRCQSRAQGVSTAIAAVGVFALLQYGPMLLPGLFYLLWFLPVIFLGLGTGHSAGYYVGAALQVLAGAWLLGWFGTRKSQDEIQVAS